MPTAEWLTERFGELRDPQVLARLIGQSDDLYTEFASVADPADPFEEKADRQHLARAISAFANGDGGIVVYGLATEGATAAGWAELADVNTARARLECLLDKAVHPVPQGLQVAEVQSGNGTGAGCLLLLVPPQTHTPYMAKCGEDRYYKRNGGASGRMDHYDLERMFGRRPRPSLELLASSWNIWNRGTINARLRLVLAIENHGQGVAKYPYVEIEELSEGWELEQKGVLPHLQSNRLIFAGDASVAVEAGQRVDVAEMSQTEGHAFRRMIPPLIIRYVIGAENMPPRADVLCLTEEHILAQAPKVEKP